MGRTEQTELMKLSALELGRKIKSRKISIKEAVMACREQIEREEKQIHAYITLQEKGLEERILEVEEGMKKGRYTGPLAGVPMAVKDNICTAGMKTTCASRILENFIPSYTAEAVRLLEEKGAVILGKTNMDEFAMGSTTETSAFGITRNPWNTRHVPGGSSGGSCAAVAAGEAFYALGSDTGGSIRQPASYCGVTGIKPTYGTVSRFGLVAYGSSLDQIGPVGRNVSDCAAVLEEITAYDTKDSTSIKRKETDFTQALAEGIKGIKIGVPKEYLAEGLDPDIRAAIEEAMNLFSCAGAEVEIFELGLVDYAIPAYYVIASAEASSNLERFDGVKYGRREERYEGLHDMYKKSRSRGFGAEVKRRIMLGTFVLSSGYYDAYYLKALKVKAMIKQSFDRAFERYDMILGPASPVTAPEIGKSLQNPLQMYLGDVYTVAVNLAGLPGISVPCGLDRKGLPIGLQLIGNCFEEKKVIRAAYNYEVLRGEWKMAWEREGR
ncbi:Asp-tRNA(Asn)/Glu-tRNA(Gln) amidotransferase subunit GatA [Lachnospiraceae bacterium 62-35]